MRGLIDIPTRVVRAYEQWFAGHGEDPGGFLQRTFAEVAEYDETMVLANIGFVSDCEHQMVPITGCAHRLPAARSDRRHFKVARVLDAYSKRLQIQEKMAAEIANTLVAELQPRGVGVVVEGVHGCMPSRGVHRSQATLVTSRILGRCATDRRPVRSSWRRSPSPLLPGPGTFAAERHPIADAEGTGYAASARAHSNW